MEFKPIELSDRDTFNEFLAKDKPVSSELTFTNLFMWRCRYMPVWRNHKDCLLVIMKPKGSEPFGLRPIGPGEKKEALRDFIAYLREISPEPRISRVCKAFVEMFVNQDDFYIEEDRDNSDYVYLSESLIKLPGNRYHKKKNHLNKFIKSHEFEYRSLEDQVVEAALDLQEDWCELKDCVENPELFEEDLAVYEALKNRSDLGFKGGAILMDSKVEAFSLGELLNHEMAVIHIENANPHIPGLYAAINQMFCAAEWANVKYVNREQDLGVEGLRKAKLSYYPDHMVEKFTLIPKQ
jgi:hypothetical protein